MTSRPTLPSNAGICRLCLAVQPLVKSHIIPDFQFKALKKTDGYFHVLSPNPAKKELKQQRGFTERLLCAECDNVRLQRNEDYFARLWSRSDLPNTTQAKRFLIFRDHDYKRTKNFLLSILWRMSISSREVFEAVSLGSKHEEVLRSGLLADREFAEDEYAVTVTAPFIDGKFYEDFIVQPDSHRLHGNRLYRCVISGMLYTFFVGSAPLVPEVKAMSLRKAEFPVARMDLREIPFLADAIHRLGQANVVRVSQA
jgi:hypothetical protein